MEAHGDWADAFSQVWTLAFHFCAKAAQFDIRSMVVEHGRWFYLITFLWTFVEGETFVIFAATFAAQGLLDPFLLLISAWLGSFSGDQLYFYIGRRYGGRLLPRYPRSRATADTPLRFLWRYTPGFFLTFPLTHSWPHFSSFPLR